MARTLKTTGIAADLVYLVAADSNNTTFKEWVSSDVSANMTLTGCNTGTASWKGTTLGYWQPNTDALNFASGHRPVIPTILTVFFLMIDGPASTTGSNGLMDVVGASTIVRNGNASDAFVLLGGGAGIAVTTTQITSQRSYSLGFQGRNSIGDNLTWYGLESGSAAVDNTTSANGSYPDTGVAITSLGIVAARGDYKAKYVLCGMANRLLTTAEYQSIHDDPIGTLFDTTADSSPGSRLAMLGVG